MSPGSQAPPSPTGRIHGNCPVQHEEGDGAKGGYRGQEQVWANVQIERVAGLLGGVGLSERDNGGTGCAHLVGSAEGGREQKQRAAEGIERECKKMRVIQ